MRGQKASIRSSLSNQSKYNANDFVNSKMRFFSRPFEEDDGHEEDEIKFLIIDELKQKRTKRKKRSSDPNRKSVFSPANGIFPSLKQPLSKSKLGIPIGEFLYFGPPFGRFNPSEEKETKYKIIRSKGKSYRSDKTLCSYIFKILSKSDTALGVKDIVLALKKHKVLKEKNKNNYSIVYRTITRNIQFFVKTGKATFSLRKGFKQWQKPEKINIKIEEDKDFASLQDLVISAVKQLSPIEMCSNPLDVFRYLKTFGFNGEYKNIYDAMHSNNFTKHKSYFRLIAR